MQLQWTQFKSIVVSKALSIQWVEDAYLYYLTIIDGNIQYECKLDKNPSDPTDLNDFVTNFKAAGNASFSDIDGIPLFRLKASKKGWNFWTIPIEITTSTLDTLYAKDSSENAIPGITCKIYNSSNAEITTPGLLGANLATCVKTVIDFEPLFDYEIIGGALRINSNPAADVRMWIVGAPDIPAAYGGSKEFASGVNLKFMAPDSSFEIDGRVTKFLQYNPATHQSKMRIILRHPAGLAVNMQIVIHIYRQ